MLVDEWDFNDGTSWPMVVVMVADGTPLVANNEPDRAVADILSCGSLCVIDNGLYPIKASRGLGKLPGTTEPCIGSDS